MRHEEVTVTEALGAILMHNVADDAGTNVLKKGTRLTEGHLAQLAERGRATVNVAILE